MIAPQSDEGVSMRLGQPVFVPARGAELRDGGQAALQKEEGLKQVRVGGMEAVNDEHGGESQYDRAKIAFCAAGRPV
jgi:hypothetical protein